MKVPTIIQGIEWECDCVCKTCTTDQNLECDRRAMRAYQLMDEKEQGHKHNTSTELERNKP